MDKLANMKSLKRFILEAQSRIVYRQYAKLLAKLPDKTLRSEIKEEVRRGFLETINIDDTGLKYRLALEKGNLQKLEQMVGMSQ